MKKKGLTWSFVITLIGIVLALVILIAVYISLNTGQEVDKQVCHQSVVYKATTTAISEDADLAKLPLKCETENICITTSILFDKNCDEDFLGEEYSSITVHGDNPAMLEQINKIIADKFFECWWMMGQGKTRVYSRGINADFNTRCNACTRIAFSQDTKDRLPQITGTTKYMATHTIPNSPDITYWQYITNSQSNFIYGYSEDADTRSTGPKVIVFAESSYGALSKWLGIGATSAGGLLSGAYIGGAIGSIVPLGGTAAGALIGAGIGGLGGYLLGDDAVKKYEEWKDTNKYVGTIQMLDDDLQHLRKFGCTSFSES